MTNTDSLFSSPLIANFANLLHTYAPLNDAIIDSLATLLIPLCDDLTESDANLLLDTIDSRDDDDPDNELPLLFAEIRDTIRDNTEFDLID